MEKRKTSVVTDDEDAFDDDFLDELFGDED
jgi:hypothetical protein